MSLRAHAASAAAGPSSAQTEIRKKVFAGAEAEKTQGSKKIRNVESCLAHYCPTISLLLLPTDHNQSPLCCPSRPCTLYTFKGGSGKTTLTTLTATILAKMGYNAIIIDADRQGNCTKFFEDNPRPAAPPVDPDDAALMLEMRRTREEVVQEDVRRAEAEQQEIRRVEAEVQAFLQQQQPNNAAIPDVECDSTSVAVDFMDSTYIIPTRDEVNEVQCASATIMRWASFDPHLIHI